MSKNTKNKPLFKVVEPTLLNMNAIAEFNTIVSNYLKMKKLLKDGEKYKVDG